MTTLARFPAKETELDDLAEAESTRSTHSQLNYDVGSPTSRPAIAELPGPTTPSMVATCKGFLSHVPVSWPKVNVSDIYDLGDLSAMGLECTGLARQETNQPANDSLGLSQNWSGSAARTLSMTMS